MLFNTIAFAKFFLVVFVGSWLLSKWPRARFWYLAAASYLFYSGLDLFSLDLIANEVGDGHATDQARVR